MRRYLLFLSIAFLFVSCGRKDDTVWCYLSIRNHSQEDIYVETNFPPSMSSKSESSQGIIHFHSSLELFEESMHGIKTYDDLATQILDRYPEAMIWIYSVNEDNEKGALLRACSLAEYPAITYSEEYGPGLHLHSLHPDDCPFNVEFSAVWKDNHLKVKFY